MTVLSYQDILNIAKADRDSNIPRKKTNDDHHENDVAHVATRVDNGALPIVNGGQPAIMTEEYLRRLVRIELVKNIVGLTSNISFFAGLLFVLRGIDSPSSLLLSTGLLSVYTGYNGIQVTLNLHSIIENPKLYLEPVLAFPFDIQKIKQTLALNTVGGFSFLLEKGLDYALVEKKESLYKA